MMALLLLQELSWQCLFEATRVKIHVSIPTGLGTKFRNWQETKTASWWHDNDDGCCLMICALWGRLDDAGEMIELILSWHEI